MKGRACRLFANLSGSRNLAATFPDRLLAGAGVFPVEAEVVSSSPCTTLDLFFFFLSRPLVQYLHHIKLPDRGGVPEGKRKATLSAHQWRSLPRAVPSTSCALPASGGSRELVRRPLLRRPGRYAIERAYFRRVVARRHAELIAPGRSGSLRRHPRPGPVRGNLLHGGSPGGAFGRAISRPVTRRERAASVTGLCRPFRSLGILRRRRLTSTLTNVGRSLALSERPVAPPARVKGTRRSESVLLESVFSRYNCVRPGMSAF